MKYAVGDKVKFRTPATKHPQYGPWGSGEIMKHLEEKASYQIRVAPVPAQQYLIVAESDVVGIADFDWK